MQLLAALGARPEWNALRKLARDRMERHFAKLARLFASEGEELDYARLQYQRGVFAGMKFLLDGPTIEAAKLKRLLEELEADNEGSSR